MSWQERAEAPTTNLVITGDASTFSWLPDYASPTTDGHCAARAIGHDAAVSHAHPASADADASVGHHRATYGTPSNPCATLAHVGSAYGHHPTLGYATASQPDSTPDRDSAPNQSARADHRVVSDAHRADTGSKRCAPTIARSNQRGYPIPGRRVPTASARGSGPGPGTGHYCHRRLHPGALGGHHGAAAG